MKKRGFTLVEVSILFVIFLIVAFLVAPLSMDDTVQANFTSRWKNVQSDFSNIFYSINTQKDSKDFDLHTAFAEVITGQVKNDVDAYKINFLNGTYPNITYRFSNFMQTQANSTIAYKFFNKPQDGVIGILLYDINGSRRPNIWGKDVFGFNIYSDRFEPFCKEKSISEQKSDCSKNGTGLCCSSYYLQGGSFD